MAFLTALATMHTFRRVSLALAVLLVQATGGARAEDNPESLPEGSLESCLDDVIKGKSAEISCDYDAFLTAEERADMQKLTRGYFQDASCRVTVKITRALVDQAVHEADTAFSSPPQPVACTIKTKSSAFPIAATFSPRVVFKGGVAIEGSPGLGNVTGVNAYLAWPIVQYVNRAPGMRRDMLTLINLIRPKLAEAMDAARAK